MKNQFVKDLTIGTKVNDIFYLINRWQFDKRSGGKFLVLELADRSGIIKGKIWDNVEVLYSACSPGNFVKVVGDVTEYNDEIQITIADIKAVPEKEVSLKDFIASSRFDLNEMYQELTGYIELVTDADYQRLLKSAFANQDLVTKFKLAPASAGIHHAYIGGLLEHTLFMLRLARQVPVVYPELDYSLVITGIIFHDIGKIREYQYDKVISHTDEGYLIGHIVIGYEIVKAEIEKLKDFPEEKKQVLLHIILSHHGIKEYGSPITPKFAEAYFVHNLDNLDARMMMFREAVEKSADVKWSDYHRFLETRIFIKNYKEERQ